MHDMFRLHIARDYRANDQRQARLNARVREARALQASSAAPAPARRVLGRSLIRLGERIAAEPAFRSARSP